MARGSASIFMADVANQVLEPIMTRTELLIPVIVSCIDTVTTSATTRQQMFDVEYEVLQCLLMFWCIYLLRLPVTGPWSISE